VRTPNVLWAERKDRLFITIEVTDCADAKVDIQDEGKLTFKGTGGTEKAAYECSLQLLKGVNAKARGRPYAAAGLGYRAQAALEMRRRPEGCCRCFCGMGVAPG